MTGPGSAPAAGSSAAPVVDLPDSPGARSRVLLLRVLGALDREFVLDGMDHGAESTLDDLLREAPGLAFEAFVDLTRSGDHRLAADLLRLLGRSPAVAASPSPYFATSRRFLLVRALESPSVDVRDAGVCAAETWGDLGLVPVLRGHRDPVAWLAEYAVAVAADVEADRAGGPGAAELRGDVVASRRQAVVRGAGVAASVWWFDPRDAA